MSRRHLLALLIAAALPSTAWAQNPSFGLVNNTGRVIQEVYATAASRRDWGHDRLGTEVIRPGRTHVVRVPFEGECILDIKVVTSDGAQEVRRGVDTCRTPRVAFGPRNGDEAPGATEPRRAGRGVGTAAGGENPSFNLLNRSRQLIREVYASPASRRDWGTDLLGSASLPPGRSFAVRLPLGECFYDLRVVYDGGRAEERRGLNTCHLSTVPFP